MSPRALIYEARAQVAQNGVGPIARPIISQLCDALEAALSAADGIAPAVVWPEQLTPDLRYILGRMCFHLAPYAHVYQAAGEFFETGEVKLRTRAEDEQAFMLHKHVGFWLAAGDDWHKLADADLARVAPIADQKMAERRK